jgi:hypothetical protein
MTLRVERRMRQHAIRPPMRRRFRGRTTNSHHGLPVVARTDLRGDTASSGLAGRHPLRANHRRVALSGRRIGSLHP